MLRGKSPTRVERVYFVSGTDTDPDLRTHVRIVATKKKHQNNAVLDPWTVVHFAAGMAAGLVSLPRPHSLGLAVGYEFLEQWLERRKLGQELFDAAGPEILSNAAMDVAVFAAGHYLGTRWNESD